ncbi:MAG: two-component system response regulator BaeR [Oleiphilaceae bacterium]|jgi:two-component system response regulator BaeR
MILIVEDEPKLAMLLNDYLVQSGYNIHVIADGADVVAWVKLNQPDLILLDIMLPNKNGIDICKEIRVFSHVPIIMTTAKVEEIDRLLGLELGADDYVCKPYSPREVVARVKAILRRSCQAGVETEVTDLEMDLQKYKAVYLGKDLDLTAIEFHLLALMKAEPGRIFSRQQLMDSAYVDHRIVSERTIDSHIKKLRKKIRDISKDHELVQSVYGVGYRFEVP